jgi:hypothetical protein
MQSLRTLGAVLSFPALGFTLLACGGDEKDLAPGTNANNPNVAATASAATSMAPKGQASTTTAASAIVNPKPANTAIRTIPADAIVGTACKQDPDCGTGLRCVTSEPSLIGGTVAGGFCSLECQADPSICKPYGAECLGSPEKAYCTLGCSIGAAEEKCLGRADMACIPFVFGYVDGACYPMCQNTQNCGEGTECLPLYLDFDSSTYEIFPTGGVCGAIGTVPPEWKKDGEPCASSDDCEGMCAPPVDGGKEGYCTSLCNFLSEGLFCNADPKGDVRSVCVTGFFFEDDRIPSDLGVCTPTCNTDADCHGGTFCNKFTNPEANVAVGRNGLCEDPRNFASNPTAPDNTDMSSKAEERLMRALDARQAQPLAR